jgi:integrase
VIKNIQIEMAFPMERYSINLKHIGKSNLLQARNLAIEIEIDVAIGTFDTTLRKYKSKVDGKLHEQKAFVDIFVDWTKMYRNRDCEINVDYNATRNMLRRWGNFGVNDVVTQLGNESFNEKTYNERRRLLNVFFSWLEKNKKMHTNPLADVQPKKVQKRKNESRTLFYRR